MFKNLLLKSIYCLFIACFSFLEGVIFEVENLNKFEEIVQKLDKSSLVLFDVDYTLLTPEDASLKPYGKGLRRNFYMF